VITGSVGLFGLVEFTLAIIRILFGRLMELDYMELDYIEQVKEVPKQHCKLCLILLNEKELPPNLPISFLNMNSTQLLTKFIRGSSEFHPTCYEKFVNLSNAHRVFDLTLRGSHSHELAGFLELAYLLIDRKVYATKLSEILCPIVSNLLKRVPEKRRPQETFGRVLTVITLRVQTISKYVQFVDEKIDEVNELIEDTKKHVISVGNSPPMNMFIAENMSAQREIVQLQGSLNMYPGREMVGFPTTSLELSNIRLVDVDEQHINSCLLSQDVDASSRFLAQIYTDYIQFSDGLRSLYSHLLECLALKNVVETQLEALLMNLSGYVQYLVDNRNINLWRIFGIVPANNVPCTNLSTFMALLSERTLILKNEKEKLLKFISAEYHILEFHLLDLS
jgi:hypothetical protein